MNHNTNSTLGTEKVGKLLFRLAVPSILAQVINLLYNVVDRIYIGHLPNIGAKALTGVGVTFPIIMIISAFSSLIGMGGAPKAAIEMGKGNTDKAEEILGNCFVALIGISVILTMFFLWKGEELLFLFGASEETLSYGLEYLNIYVCGTIFVQLSLGLNSFINTQGFAHIAMVSVIVGAVTNIVLDPILMFGFNMGVKGAAIATVLSQMLSAIWILKFLIGKKTILRIRRKNLRLKKEIILSVMALGLSSFVMQSTDSLINITYNSSLQRYGGDIAVGAMTIIHSLMQILGLPITGITQGAQPIISYNYGARDYQRTKQTIQLMIKSSVIYAVIFWLLMMLFPNLFVTLFNSDKVLVPYTIWAIRIYMANIFLLGIQIACQQSFVAIGQAKASIFLALFRKFALLIPFIYLLPRFVDDKVFGVFLAEPISDFFAVLVTGILFYIQINKILKVKE